MGDYFAALCRQIREWGERIHRPVSSIYFGGGTPSLAYRFFPDLKRALHDSFDLSDCAEISMECNPESATPAFVEAALDLGVKRVSVGVQTLSDPLLKRIGRAHDREDAIRALSLLTSAFPSVSADVMVGLPEQSRADVDDCLDVLLDYPLKHLSCYGLILEEGTPLFREYEEGRFVLDEDSSVDLYDAAYARLIKAGFRRYEISNFCRGDAVCRYNTSVWQYGNYLGLGLGASSFLPNEGDPFVRFRGAADMDCFLKDPMSREEIEIISISEAEREFIMLGLRLELGLDLLRYRELFGKDFLTAYREKLKGSEKYFAIQGDRFAIRAQYLYISNTLINLLI